MRQFAPIFISFNGGFKPREEESQLDALVRLLSMQLMSSTPTNPYAYKYAQDDLLGHIQRTAGDSKVILLIDELNMLAGGPLGAEVVDFLKQHFLDKAGRYLVFTSHVPLNTDEISNYKLAPYYPTSTPSPRGVVTVHQPHSIELEHLRAMPGCQSLTSAEVAIYGGIPSLIYSAKGHDAYTPRQRFLSQHIEIVSDKQTAVLGWFIRQVLGDDDGVISAESAHFTQFYSFASIPTANEAWWPMCYISCILNLFPVLRTLPFAELVEIHLNSAASRVASGVDWELIVQAALMLRCIDAKINGTTGPFDIAERGVFPDVECHTLVGEITTLDQAHSAIITKLKDVKRPTIILFACSYADFPDYDGFIAYASPSRPRIFGHQEKRGRAYPKRPAPAGDWINKSLHLRGIAPAKANQLRGWVYLSRMEILHLLGSSLKPLYPAAWPDPPAV